MGCHQRGAKAVDGRLDHHVGKGHQRILKACGQANLQHLPNGCGVRTYLPQRNPVFRICSGQVVHNTNAGCCLADYSGEGCSLHAHTQHCHQQDIKYSVCQGGNRQILKGLVGLPHRVEDSGGKIVEYRKQTAGKIYPHILYRLRMYLLRGSHESENRTRQRYTQDCNQGACH